MFLNLSNLDQRVMDYCLQYCIVNYGDNAEDVCHEALLIAFERGYEIISFSLFKVLVREAARNLKLNNDSLNDSLYENISVHKSENEIDERILTIISNTNDSRVAAVIRDVLIGENLTACLAKHGINYRMFVKKCKQALEQPLLSILKRGEV